MKDHPHSIAAQWWQGLQPSRDGGGGDRGALARLRRAPGITSLMGLPETIGLFRRLGGTTPSDLPRVALLAGVMAHLREDKQGREGCARLLGPSNPEAPETALMSPLRFRRLIDAEGEEERLLAFRRMVALAKGALPARDLAAGLLFWGPPLRQRWIYDYWGAGQPAPLTPNGQDTP